MLTTTPRLLGIWILVPGQIETTAMVKQSLETYVMPQDQFLTIDNMIGVSETKQCQN